MPEDNRDTEENSAPADSTKDELPAYPRRLYFSSGKHLYVLVYRWKNT